MKSMEKTEVVIVGAGPVGLTMAIELVHYGVAVRIIEKAAQRTDKSKALVLWSRSLELLERSGCSAALVEAGYRVNRIKVSADKQTIASIDFDGVDSPYPYALMLPQSETERILEEFLKGLGVAVERETELLYFDDRGDRVLMTIRNAAGAEEVVETAWLIGCDGAHSTVRHQLGMAFEGNTSLIDWVLADVHLDGVPRAPEVNIVWHSEGVLAIFPISEERYRIVADIGVAQGGAAPPAPTLADVQAILNQRFPGGARATDAVWLSTFRINERKVEDYCDGRVFLAGDAAHVHSPAGGQGMNTGMQDACNLAWKLALVARGKGTEPLLDSYSLERSPIAEAVLKVTGRMTAMATLENGFVQNVRNHAMALVLGLPSVRTFAANIASEISIGYADSPLNGPGTHRHPAPGERAPIRADEPPVGAGDAPQFTLFADASSLPNELRERFAGIVDLTPRQPYHPDGLWLVRPDGYVALATKHGDWEAVISYLDAFLAP